MKIFLASCLVVVAIQTCYSSPAYIEQAGDKVDLPHSELYKSRIEQALELLAGIHSHGEQRDTPSTTEVSSDKEYAEKDQKDDASENSAQDLVSIHHRLKSSNDERINGADKHEVTHTHSGGNVQVTETSGDEEVESHTSSHKIHSSKNLGHMHTLLQNMLSQLNKKNPEIAKSEENRSDDEHIHEPIVKDSSVHAHKDHHEEKVEDKSDDERMHEPIVKDNTAHAHKDHHEEKIKEKVTESKGFNLKEDSRTDKHVDDHGAEATDNVNGGSHLHVPINTADKEHGCVCKTADQTKKEKHEHVSSGVESVETKAKDHEIIDPRHVMDPTDGTDAGEHVEPSTEIGHQIDKGTDAHETDIYAAIIPLHKKDGKLKPFKPDVPIHL